MNGTPSDTLILVNCGHPSGCRCEALPISRVGCGHSTAALCRAAMRVRDGRWVRGAPSHVFADLLRELRTDGYVLAQVHEPDTRGTIERWADEDMAEIEREIA